MSTILPHGGGDHASPFDEIRRVTPEGREYWSARDLMPLLGYLVWRDFANAIQRARVACTNSGSDPIVHFAGARKVARSGPAAEDYHLSRYACYLVALNGDPRKPQIAAAQTYFVVKTREAETQPAVQVMTRDELLSRAMIEATTVISELKPKADRYDRFLTAEGDWSVSETAGVIQRAGAVIGERRLFDYLDEKDWTFRDGRGKWRATQYAKDRGWLTEKPQGSWIDPETGETHLRTPQVRVTAKGADRLVSLLAQGMTA